MNLIARCAAVVLAMAAVSASAQDADWPNHPITIISGFPAGAATDTYSRKLGADLSKTLGVSIVTDSRTGAGGNIASSVVAQARPDGYTFLLGTAGTHAINAALYPSLGFNVVKDFSRIALLGNLPNVLLVNPEKHPDIKTCADLIALARKKPGELNYASTGNGASGHLAATQFGTAAGATFTHVPYRGQGPAITALMAGEVDFFFNQSTPSIAPVKSGKLRALATTSSTRIAALPDVPTAAEACNLPGFESTTWYALFGPANLPPAIQARMSNAVIAAIGTPEFKSWLVDQGIAPIADAGPDAFLRLQLADIDRWAKVVKASGAHVD
ncbi:tripartite tricarboxylate transporter substrate binding protein [soil metagenome]